jgi:hypothetical protein
MWASAPGDVDDVVGDAVSLIEDVHGLAGLDDDAVDELPSLI